MFFVDWVFYKDFHETKRFYFCSAHDFAEMFRANIQYLEFQTEDNDVTVIIELLPYNILFPHV